MTLSTHSVGEKEPPMTPLLDLENGPQACSKAEQEYARCKKVASEAIFDGDAKSDSPQDQATTKEERALEVDKMGNPAPKYPHGPKQVFFSWVAVLFAVFLVSLDKTIVSTAIPAITNDFHSLNDIGWYGSAFFFTGACCQLLIGKVYTICTPKYTFLANIFMFEVGSALCGAAPNSVAFIIGRAIAGFAAAGVQVGNVIILTSIVPLKDRPKYMGFLGLVMGVSGVIGPLLGGAFTSNVSWRWCFYINLPIGGFALLVIFVILQPFPPVKPDMPIVERLKNLDLLGEFLVIPSIVSLLFALQWGGTMYAWSNGRIIALFVVFGVCAMAFVAVEVLTQKTATISARIIKNRSIIAGMLFQFCQTSAMMLMLYYIPEWLQAIKGDSAVESGVHTIPLVLSLIVASILTGQLTSKIGYYTPFGIGSAVMMSIGSGLISTWSVDSSSGKWIGYQIVLGFGIGMGMQVATLAAQTVLDRKDVPIGMTLMFFMQQLGGAIFVSVGLSVLDIQLIKRLSGVYELDVVSMGATEFRKTVPPEILNTVLVAYNAALREVFVVGICLSCIALLGSVLIEFKSIKHRVALTGGRGSPGGPGGNPEAGEKSKGSGKPDKKV